MPIDLTAKIERYLERVIDADVRLLQALIDANALRREYDALGISGLMENRDCTDLTCHLNGQEIADFFNAINAIETTLAAGYWTYLFTVKP